MVLAAYGSQASIDYSIEVNLLQEEAGVPVCFKCPFFIFQFPYEIQNWPTEENSRNIKKFMWMLNQGQAILRTKLDKSAYSVNENIKIWIDVDSLNCSSRIKEIEISLRRHGKCGEKLHKSQSIDVLWTSKYNGLPKKFSTNGYKLYYYIPLHLVKPSSYSKCFTAQQARFLYR